MKLLDKIRQLVNTSAEPPKSNVIKIRMDNGSIEEYSKEFIITDGKNCVIVPDYIPVDNLKEYHLYFNCFTLNLACEKTGSMPQGCTVKYAKSQKYILCDRCSQELYLFKQQQKEQDEDDEL